MSCELCKPYADSVEGKPATNCPRCGREVEQIISTPDRPDARIPLTPRPHRIGIWDYESLVECLKSNFEAAFPGETMRDPQDAIQRLAATVMEMRTAEHAIAQLADHYNALPETFDAALRTAPGINPAWTENGVRAFAVETLRKVLEQK
jgi:hypothetical protein